MLLGPILQLVAAIVIVGVVVWGLMQLPIDEMFKKVARVILIVALVIWAVYVLLGMVGAAPVFK
jgi:hypothetical protein